MGKVTNFFKKEEMEWMGDMWGHKCNVHEKNAFMDKSTQVPRLYLGDLN